MKIVNVKTCSICLGIRTGNIDVLPVVSSHVETCVLLSQKKVDDYIEVSLPLDSADITASETKATYREIKEYILDKFGVKVSALYISQVKRKNGLEVGECYNKPKSPVSRTPICPSEKEKCIEDALRHFQMM